jgi:hypothetical protein
VWRHACAGSANHRALFSHDIGGSTAAHRRPIAATAASTVATLLGASVNDSGLSVGGTSGSGLHGVGRGSDNSASGFDSAGSGIHSGGESDLFVKSRAAPSHADEPDLTWATLAFGADSHDNVLLKFTRRFGRLHAHNMLLARCFSPALPNLLGTAECQSYATSNSNESN